MGIFSELKQRRIVQIVVSYLAAGWVVLEVASQLIERGVAPELVYEIALIWYLGGIPAALLIGWFHGEKGEQKAPKREIVGLSAVVLVVLGLTGGRVGEYLTATEALEAAGRVDADRIAVTYFDDRSGDGDLRFLADGLTESLIDELAAVPGLDVISRNGVGRFRDAGLTPDSVGRILEAGTVVAGAVEPVDRDRTRVTIRILDPEGVEIRRTAFERPSEDLFGLREELASEAAILLREWVGEEVGLRSTRRATNDVRAWGLYHRAEEARKDAEELLSTDRANAADEAFDRADDLARRASVRDPEWVDPPILRAAIAYRRSRIAHDAGALRRWVDVGLEHAERALEVRSGSARTLELRGTLRYWLWLQGDTPDPEEHGELLEAARRNLERAVEIDPDLSGAHYVLSHLYIREDLTLALLEARRALESDPYFQDADAALWRLATGYYDAEQFTQSRRYCDTGARQFPEDYRFAVCSLLLMTTPAATADPDSAWALLGSIRSLAPEGVRNTFVLQGRMLVGGVLARAGMADSASAVLDRTRADVTPHADPARELTLVEAAMRVVLGEEERAIDLLEEYALAHPDYSFDHHWWWRPLRGERAFIRLSEGSRAHH